MELVNLDQYMEVVEKLKNQEPEVYAKPKQKYYINQDKAKSIIKQVLKNKKLNDFLISGCIEEYVEYIYKNRDLIQNVPENDGLDDTVTSGKKIELSDEDFKRTISKIVIDDIHLPEDKIEEGCNAYKKLKTNPYLYGKISEKFINRYVTFIYYNRYAIRKLVSKELSKVKIDADGNYILTDDDFIGKINCDGGHNSPLWICIDLPDEEQEESKELDGESNKFKAYLQNRIDKIKNLKENITEGIVDKEETKVVINQIKEQEKELQEANLPEVKNVANTGFEKNIVVKNLLPENERETALIAEEIARQLGLPVAQYYPAKYLGKKFSKEEAEKNRMIDGKKNSELVYMTKDIVITPNFLEPGEELVTGDRIAGYEMDISVVPSLIEKYMSKEGIPQERINELISDYRTVMAYNCFINHRDCHNGNWGFIKKKDGDYKISHIFDLEGSLDENVHQIREIYVGDVYSEADKNIDKELLMELLKDERCRAKVMEFNRLNLFRVYSNINISKGVRISQDKQRKVEEVITREKLILEETLRQIYLDSMPEKNIEDKDLEIEDELYDENEYEEEL